MKPRNGPFFYALKYSYLIAMLVVMPVSFIIALSYDTGPLLLKLLLLEAMLAGLFYFRFNIWEHLMEQEQD